MLHQLDSYVRMHIYVYLYIYLSIHICMHYSNTTSPPGPHHNDYMETDALGNIHVRLDVFKCTSCHKKDMVLTRLKCVLKFEN